jgi:hypothetical protein
VDASIAQTIACGMATLFWAACTGW